MNLVRKNLLGHLGYACAALAVAGMGWALQVVLTEVDESRQQVAQTRAVLDGVSQVGEAMSRAEAAQRGYLLAAADPFIAQRDQALAEASRALATVAALTRESATQRARIDRLGALLSDRADLMRENERRRREEGLDAVAARAAAGSGQAMSAQIVALTSEMRAEELRSLEQRRQAEREDREDVRRMLVIAVLLVLLAMIPGYVGFIVESRSRDRAEARLRDLAETLPGAVVQYRMWPDGRSRYEYLSSTAERMRGVRREDALGDPKLILDTILPEDLPAFLEALARGAKALEPVEHDYRVRAPDGSIRWLRTTAAPRAMPDGSVLWSAFWFDVTEKRALLAALREAKEAAEAATRAKSTFLATMSHEIRTPMNGVLGMLELLSLTNLDKEQRTTLEVIRQSGRSLLRIIDDILDFSKVEAGKLELRAEPASVADVIARTCDIYRGSASSKGLVIYRHVDERISRALLFDPVRLQQILGNCLSNAIKFTPTGSIEVRADLLARSDDAETVQFTVRDTGIGVSAEDQKKLFAPFSQAGSGGQHGGTGLGLAICRRLAHMMDGALEMQSEPGRGTSMILTLSLPVADPAFLAAKAGIDPRAQAEFAHSPRLAPSVVQAAAERTLVLIVDDHPVNRMVLQRQVNALGYAAESANDGVEALAMWGAGRHALVLTDCNMPEMDGYKLARAIRERERRAGAAHTTIIACTANALAGEAEKCFEAGMDDYLPKPVQLAQLGEKLARWLPLPEAVPAPVDLSVLAEISAGDRVLEREIVLRFHRENAEDARALERALEANEIEEVTRCAHRIKGAARTVGANVLADVCERLERAGRVNDLDAVAANVRCFREELARLDSYIESLGLAA